MGGCRLKDVRLLEASIRLAHEPALVGAARRFVDQTVTYWALDAISEEARLITSELCANAVLHARTEFRVTLRSDGLSYLRIEVRDENGRMTPSEVARENATSGRGLAIVATLASSWGTELDGAGKVVWAEIDLMVSSGSTADRP